MVEEGSVAGEAGQQEEAEVDGEGVRDAQQRALRDGLRRLAKVARQVCSGHNTGHLV